MQFDFDKKINRRNTDSIKWDKTDKYLKAPDVIPLWVADMDFESPQVVQDAVQRQVEFGNYGYYEAPESYYESIVNWQQRRHGWKMNIPDISTRHIIQFVPGVIPGLNFAIQAFTEPGDKIIIQPPVYRPFFETITRNERQVLENPLMEREGRYEMDFELLEMQANEAKMLILCSPHNPVGRVWTKSELERLVEICTKNEVLIVSDEIHADLVYSGNKHIPVASVSPAAARISLTLVSPAKAFNMQSFQIASAIILNEQLREQYRQHLKKFSIYMMNIFSIRASEAAYTAGAEWLDALLVYLESNRNFLKDFLEDKMPQIKFSPSEGTYLAWLDCRELNLSQEALNDLFLKKAKVGLLSGTVFGAQGEGFMRLNFACTRATLEDALERIRSSI